jgi:uncharacterized phosphosugar-binding protein
MTALRRIYRDQTVAIMDRLLATEAAAMDAARDAFAAALRADQLIHVAGSGHSHLLALEVFYRAGGIAAVRALLDRDLMLHRGAERSTLMEREPGRAAAVLAGAALGPGDVLVVVSNSGRNAYPVELALIAKAAGATVIALTSRRHSGAAPSRHPSGKRLIDLADIVLDNGGVPGDAGLTVPGHPAPMGPTSTLIGAWLLHSLIAEAVAELAAEGITVDVWRSANAAEGDNSAALIDRWRQRVRDL